MRSAPNILVLHLKRFDYSYIGKLSHFVMYPETLSGKSFINDFESNEKVNFKSKLQSTFFFINFNSN